MPLGCRLPTIIVREMTAVPKELIEDIELERRALTVRNVAKLMAEKAGFESKQPDAYLLYKETDGYLYVPRNHKVILHSELRRGIHYDVAYRNAVQPHRVDLGVDQVTLGPNEKQPFDQKPAFEALVANPDAWPFGRVLVLRCGAGKTAIALKAAHARQGRTLWVTVNTTLLEQAKRDITQWLGIPEERIGHVQGKKELWEGYSIAVSMLHSIALREYGQSFYDYWDLVIFDEGDVLGTKEFHPVVGRFRGERWMLTATRKREDGMEILIEKHVGPVCYSNTEYDLVPDCYFVQTQAKAEKVLAYAGWDPLRHAKRVCFPIVARKLLEDDERNKLMFKLVERACEKGRTCLVLGGSVDGLAYACQQARAQLPHLRHGLVVGRVDQRERHGIIQGSDVVWATERLAYRGLDRPAFDTLLFATLTSAKMAVTRQSAGRILRAQVDKRQPLVLVMSDIMVEPLAMLASKLARLFKKEGWPLHNADPLFNLRRANVQAQQQELKFYGD